MDLLGKDAILQKRELRSAYVKAFGGNVMAVELTATERDAMDLLVTKVQKARGEDAARTMYTAFWILFGVRDNDRNRLFADSDIDAVAALPMSDVRRVYRTIAKLNGIGEDEDEEPPKDP